MGPLKQIGSREGEKKKEQEQSASTAMATGDG
jgi:hypothetical protein